MNTTLKMSTNPQYVEALAVRDRLAEALRIQQDLEAEHRNRLDMLCVAPGQQPDEVERALNMADGRPIAAGNAALSEAIRDCQGNQVVLQAGIERQQQRLADLAGNLSAEYCQSRRAEHVAIIEQLRKGLEQVRAAIESENSLRDDIRGSGYRDLMPGLHQLTFERNSPEEIVMREISHYLAIHGGKLSDSKKVTGIALSDFEMFGASGQVGKPLTVSEVTAELLRYHGKFDPSGEAVNASRVQQLAGLIG